MPWAGGILGSPLLRPGGAGRELPVVVEQVVEVSVVPLGRLVGPCALEPAGDGVGTLAGAEGVRPADALRLDGATLRLGADVFRTGGTMALAEGMPPDDESHCLLVVHRHPPERLPNVLGRSQGIRVTVGPLRVNVYKAHLYGSEGVTEFPVTAVALVSEPRVLRAPEDLVGLHDVLPPEAEAERLEPHRFQGAVSGEDDEIAPGDLAAVLLLDRPEQAARLVEARVVGPAIERCEALSALRRRRPCRRRCGTCRQRATSSG